MSATPSFSLVPCPQCSTRLGLERPMWRYAANTSATRKQRCYFFTGCKHAAEVIAPTALHCSQQEWTAVQAAWEAKVAQLFTHQTERWSAEQRESWRKVLADKASIVGATERLELSPDNPAQPTTTEE